MGEIENGTGALIQHVRIEAFRAQQRHVALQALPHLLEAGELAFEYLLAALDIGARSALAGPGPDWAVLGGLTVRFGR